MHANRLMKISLAESLPLVKADLAWNITINVTGNNGTIKISGEGQSVCVLDTGLDLTHQAFLNRTIPGYDFVNSDDNPSDDNGHGTHVSGIAASRWRQERLSRLSRYADRTDHALQRQSCQESTIAST